MAHIAVEDGQMDVVRAVAGRHGVTVADDRECLRVPARYDGGAPEVAQRIAEAGLTVNVAYFGVNGDIILATTDFKAAREALGL